MADYGFGGSRGGVIQMAYVVPDLRAAIDQWVRDLRIGPWFMIEHWTGDHPVYRGRPSTAAASIAMASVGTMQIELIQPEDENPSVYREAIDRKGYGFHHFGRASDDVDADIAALERDGYSLAFRAGVPTGGDVAYMDGGSDKPGFVELIQATRAMDEVFTGFWRAAIGWDGSDAIRPMIG